MKSNYSWDIIKKFSGNDQDCFTFQDVVAEYPDIDKIYLSKANKFEQPKIRCRR